MDIRTTQRKGSFKKTIDADDARRKRIETSSELRKVKREEGLLKKRREGLPEPAVVADASSSSTPSLSAAKVSDIPQLVAALASQDMQTQFEATLRIRKLLSIEKSPPIDQVINSGAVPRFVQYLTAYEHPKLQLEAAWALTNIASGSSAQTKVIIESGAVPHFIQLLLSPSEEVREQAGWAIGNIAGDGAAGRDLLLHHGAMETLLKVFQPSASITFVRTATWTLSNLCRGKPTPDFNRVRVCLPHLVALLQAEDEEVLTDTCWAVSYLSDGPNEKIASVVAAGICPHLIKLLSHPNTQVCTPALRAVGNIVTGDESQTQAVLDCNPVPRLRTFLESSRKGVRKEACWVVSNIAAGTSAQIQALVDGGVFPPMIKLMLVGEFEVKREICWALSNAVSGGTNPHIAYLVKNQCLKPLCEILKCSDAKIVLVALEAIENILRSGEEISSKSGNANPYISILEEAEGVDAIDELQNHTNGDIYKRAVKILENFFQAEEDTENVNNANSFAQPFQAGKMQFTF